MKKIILSFALICISMTAISANHIFAKYSDMKDAEFMSLNIGLMKVMYGLSASEIISQLDEDIQTRDALEYIDKIEEIQIINTKNKAFSKMNKDIKVLRKEYKELMSLVYNEENLLFLFNDLGEKHELVVFAKKSEDKSPKSASTIVLIGDFTIQDVGKMMDFIISGNTSDTTSISSTEGALPYQFSISTSKTVQFSQGNLMYQPSTDTWRFADNQYDYIGLDNRLISQTYDGWIDLFGFGTGNNPTQSSTQNQDYPDYTEWGSNAISNGGSDSTIWRTLSYNEFWFLFWKRQNAEALFSLGEINGTYGLILLPDNWKKTKKTPAFISWEEYRNAKNSGQVTEDWINKYDIEKWKKMESQGAVFLPAAGFRRGTGVNGGEAGNYFTSTPYDEDTAYEFSFNANGIYLHRCNRFSGCCIRLVRDSQ